MKVNGALIKRGEQLAPILLPSNGRESSESVPYSIAAEYSINKAMIRLWRCIPLTIDRST